MKQKGDEEAIRDLALNVEVDLLVGIKANGDVGQGSEGGRERDVVVQEETNEREGEMLGAGGSHEVGARVLKERKARLRGSLAGGVGPLWGAIHGHAKGTAS